MQILDLVDLRFMNSSVLKCFRKWYIVFLQEQT